MSERSRLTSTYRLQLHAGFDFAAAAAVVPYLADLGVSHLYLSPVLQAAPGSMHGYDVVDHTAISTELGGRSGLAALADHAHRHGLGIVVDVVPNHMAVPTPLWLNRPLWSVLRDGRASEFAEWFDIDWELRGGRLGLPILGRPLSAELAAGRLVLDEHAGEQVIRYHDQAFPVRPGTESDSVENTLRSQHYLLAGWRERDHVLGYRRFFDVDTLIAVRVERPAIFDATHHLLVALYDEGTIDGFRIDHPDGLADPEDYLDRLRDATGGAWVVVEKILAGHEALPPTWSCAGTTGYDAIAAIQAALVPPTGAALDSLWQDVAASGSSDSGLPSLAETELRSKAEIVDQLLQPEILRLVRRTLEAAADRSVALGPAPVRAALEAMLRHVETYRAYLRLDIDPPSDALDRIHAMGARARQDQPELADTIGVLERLLGDTHTTSSAGRDLVIRFQQVCGPVMAKGVEDTTFYRWHRFIALNEVGGDPLTLDDGGPDWVHTWARRQSSTHPAGMTTLSTHDTKRDEHVRARILAAGEQSERWSSTWDLVRALAEAHGVDLPTAYLLMQTVVGAWPISENRLQQYAEKAIREAKLHTNWNDPDPEYEGRVSEFVAACLADGPVAEAVASWVAALTPAAETIELSAKLVQLTVPGIPDVYQGTESVTGFLVDPDNRRPVDFDHRARLLRTLDTHADAGAFRLDDPAAPRSIPPRGSLLRDEARVQGTADARSAATLTGTSAAKLWVVSRVLRLRRDRPELFAGEADYVSLQSSSPYAWGFLRMGSVATLAQRWPSKLAAEGFDGATVTVPDGVWTDVLTGRRHTAAGAPGLLRCADVYRELPVALLVRGDR